MFSAIQSAWNKIAPTKARVTHPSQPHREGWDVNSSPSPTRLTRVLQAVLRRGKNLVIPTEAKRSGGTPEFALRSQHLTRILQTLLLCVAMITMLGANDTNSRYERVGHTMMCACSCGQILLECNHVGCPDSARMIDELHTQVATGANDRTIMDWFVAKYGAIILASPIRGGFDNVAWITPIALFLLAIVGTAVLVRIWHTRSLRTATATGSIKIPGLNRTEADTLRDRIRRETEY